MRTLELLALLVLLLLHLVLLHVHPQGHQALSVRRASLPVHRALWELLAYQVHLAWVTAQSVSLALFDWEEAVESPDHTRPPWPALSWPSSTK